MRRQVLPAIRMLFVAIVVLGLAYPLTMTGVAQALFPHQADGSLITRNGKVIGSEHVGQAFTSPEYFQTRPSAAGNLASGAMVQDVDASGQPVRDRYPADPNDLSAAASGASNQGPSSTDLLATINERTVAYREANHLSDLIEIPIDAVTASGSGVDPHISVANARLQAPRVAEERGLGLPTVLALVEESTDGRSLAFLGEPGVNVLELNLSLDAISGVRGFRDGSRVEVGIDGPQAPPAARARVTGGRDTMRR